VAKAAFDRIENLYKVKAVSTQVYEEAKGQMELAKGQLDLADTQLSYTSITAPVNGVVIMNLGAVGKMAQVGQPVAVVADLTDLIVNISLPTTYWNLIQENQENLIITIEKEDGEKKELTLEQISPIIKADSASFTLTCALENNSLEITSGMYVEIDIIYETYTNVLSLPHHYINADNSLFIYDETRKNVTKVFLDDMGENDYYRVLDDSFEGKWIVLDGSSMIVDGQIVNAQEKEGIL
jgi:RND family efflux transporter MFP subunit